jgi:hypothetical protein
MSNFTFLVLPVGAHAPSAARSRAFLITDDWNDWFEYRTQYSLIVKDESGSQHDIGQVKIGQFQWTPEQRRPAIPNEFDKLDEQFFSLGQDDSYYEALNKLSSQIREAIFTGLRDVAASPEVWEKARLEKVMQGSLLRSVSESTVAGQFRRMTQGGARLTSYKFSFTLPPEMDAGQPPPTLLFNVQPESNPPTNIHVLIGRNGVGKTHTLNRMTRAILGEEDSGAFASTTRDASSAPPPFASLVSVTFSAFDPFQPFPEMKDNSRGIKYSYVGLKPYSDEGKSDKAPKNLEALTDDFANSMKACRQGARASRWRRALEMLGSDATFKEAEVAALADSEDVSGIFGKLSAGHKIVLLTITRLVETVEERTIVLIDEPEAHLHPPLLSAFVRSLSDLLINRNGVAIIATHSPVVLQEVPKCCAWKLRRNGRIFNAERPEIETFGENVGVLTREIFGLEVTHSGFHKLLGEEVERGHPLEIIVDRFNEQLGAEARAILMALIAAKESGQKKE